VRELRVRVHLAADQLPADGEIYLDGIWLR
jgi:hypothetical protein